MLEVVLLVGMLLFAVSSAYFYLRGRAGLNSAFLVSTITLISYVLMWQGDLAITSDAGELILPTRWLFYGASCTLLMFEIAQAKGIRGARIFELFYLTAIVMFTGYLAARDTSAVRWIHFAISSLAYLLLLVRVFSASDENSRWITKYILFGWTVFPIVFLLAPTGIGLIGAAIANLLYLLLDIFTKIVFNIELGTRA
jgi:sensory rhodopsin